MAKQSPHGKQPNWNQPELTKTAEHVYRKLYQESERCIQAGDNKNSRVTLFRMVDEAITKLIPQDPINPQRALSGPLANIFRVSKGRSRICYIASSKTGRIVVLYISKTARKAGDVNDPYRLFTKIVLSGQYDDLFKNLGVKLPKSLAASASESYLIQ